MKIQINPTRITLNEFNECPIDLPKFKRSKKIIQGGNLLSPTKKTFKQDVNDMNEDMFLLVDINGTTIQDKFSSPKFYYGKKPSLAAVKAYYSMVRGNDLPTHLMGGNIESIRKEALKFASDNDVNQYMTKVKNSRSEPSATIYLRRPKSNKIYKYTVEYHRVLKPNKHEIEKGITKVAKAIRQ